MIPSEKILMERMNLYKQQSYNRHTSCWRPYLAFCFFYVSASKLTINQLMWTTDDQTGLPFGLALVRVH
jgi:hypothetical protein